MILAHVETSGSLSVMRQEGMKNWFIVISITFSTVITSVTLNNSSDESQHNYLEAAGGKELTPVTSFSLSLESRQSETSAVKFGFAELKLLGFFFVFLNQLL